TRGPAMSLAVDLDDLERRGRRQLGLDPSGDGGVEDEDVADIIKTGLLRFYHPPVLPGERYAHQLSFLTITTELTTTAEQGEYDVAAGYEMIVGPMYFNADADHV